MGRRRPLVLAPVAVVAVLALLAAGCGGGGAPGVASVVSSTTVSAPATTQNRVLAFSRCVRANGVPNYPLGVVKVGPQQIGVSKARLQAAVTACEHLLPNLGRGPQETAQQRRVQLADALSFARCMRGHGIPRFPDPTAQGELSIQMVQAQGIDVHAPTFLRTVQTCLPASHGLLTPAKVREALHNAGG